MSFKEIHTLYSETVSESPWSPVPSCCPSPVLRIYWFCNLTSSEYIYLMSNSVRKKKKNSIYIISHLAWFCRRKTEKVRRQYSWPLNNTEFGPSKPLQPLSSQKFIYNFFIYNQLCPLLFIISHPYPWFHIQIQSTKDSTNYGSCSIVIHIQWKKSSLKWTL